MKKSKNRFYVYLYLDPRRSGVFRYLGQYLFYFEPFYIGKGTGYRFGDHLRDVKKGKKGTLKLHVLRNILKESLEPIICKIEENLSEYDAIKLESLLRGYIGTIVMKDGPLTNVLLRDDIAWTDELRGKKREPVLGANHPQFGKTRTDEEKKKISLTLSSKMKNWTDEERERWADKRRGELNGNFGKPMSQEQRDKLSVSMTNSLNHPTRGKKLSIETREKISKATSGENNGMYGVRREDHPWWQRQHSDTTRSLMSEKARNPLVGHLKMKTNISNRLKELYLSGLSFTEENFNKLRKGPTPLFKNINKYLSDDEIQQIFSVRE